MKDESIYPKYETTTDGNNVMHQVPMSGMTMRDMFAAYALGGMLSQQTLDGWCDDNRSDYAFVAYRLADAMLEARGAE